METKTKKLTKEGLKFAKSELISDTCNFIEDELELWGESWSKKIHKAVTKAVNGFFEYSGYEIHEEVD